LRGSKCGTTTAIPLRLLCFDRKDERRMMKTPKCCHFCHAEEGKPRKVGNYIVELKPLEVAGTTKMACQSCFRKTRRFLELESHTNHSKHTTMFSTFTKKLHAITLRIFGFLTLLMLFSTLSYGQGTPGMPFFPDEPAAAPIDGGLSILAAAGGAYAIKKLRDKK
jgi:hypothetical protein